MGQAAPVIGSIVRVSGSASRSSRTGGSGSSRTGGSGSSRAGGSSASSGKLFRAGQKKRICKTCPKWSYQVGARYLGSVGIYTWYHLFVVAWERNKTGMMPTYSAFPSKEGNPGMFGVVSGVSKSDSSKNVDDGYEGTGQDDDFGTLDYHFSPDYAISGEFDPSNKWKVLKDTNKSSYNVKLSSASILINAKKIKYVPTGPNSNSFAMSIVKYAQLPAKYPSVNAPGAGVKLL